MTDRMAVCLLQDAPPAPGSEVTELQRLRCIIDSIAAATNVVPKDSFVMGSSGELVSNAAFSQVSYPDKLESFVHCKVSQTLLTQHGQAGHELESSVHLKWVVCGLKNIAKDVSGGGLANRCQSACPEAGSHAVATSAKPVQLP